MLAFRRIADVKFHYLAFRELTIVLMRHRELTWELARRDITDRYAGQILGSFWAIGHPILLLGLYVFVFGYIFHIRIGNNTDLPGNYITYLLAGLVPWMAFSEMLGRSTSVVLSHSGLVKQIAFPLEILPVKTVIAALITQLIATVLLLGYAIFTNGFLPWTIVLLPVLMILQTMAMVGICYFLSAIGPFFRDAKDFVAFFTTANFFLMPMIYVPSGAPGMFEIMFQFNPFSYMIWVYQDAVYYGRFEHPAAWWVMGGGSIALYIVGYRTFRKLKQGFGDVL